MVSLLTVAACMSTPTLVEACAALCSSQFLEVPEVPETDHTTARAESHAHHHTPDSEPSSDSSRSSLEGKGCCTPAFREASALQAVTRSDVGRLLAADSTPAVAVDPGGAFRFLVSATDRLPPPTSFRAPLVLLI